jgi:hypothetical protein
MGKCSSCGLDLPGSEQPCPQCYPAQHSTLTAPQDSSSYSWSVCTGLLLWISLSYALLTYLPGFARIVVLGAAFLAVWSLDLWALSRRPWKRYGSPQPERLSFILCLCCGVVWKITDANVWLRLGGACILVSAIYRALRIATDLSKTARR